ncbi:MAG: ceramide glucosyltransferase [Paracoccaceae bacterium]
MILLAAFVAFALAVHLATLGIALWRLHRPVPKAANLPFVCLLRPVCGLDRFDAETLGSSFRQDYPDYEVIFCCASAHDPVIALVNRLIADHPQVRARLFIGDIPISGNPKLNNVARGWHETTAGLICMTDSNVALPPDYLRQVVASFGADTGLVTAPPLGVRAEGLWGALECAFLNSFQARFQLVADAAGNGFAQGKTLCWRRDVAEAGGGLAALGREMAEDVASTKLVRRQGLKVRLAPRPYPQPIGRRTLEQVWSRQLRWARVRRAGFVWLYLPEILTGAVPPMVALAVLLSMAGASPLWLAAFAAVWFGAEWGMARAAGWPARPVDLAAMAVRDAMLPLLWLWSWRARGFVWRGNAMEADRLTAAEGRAE